MAKSSSHSFLGLIFSRFAKIFTHFFTRSKAKDISEADSIEALRGTQKACLLHLSTETKLKLQILSDSRKVPMSYLVNQLVNEEWKKDKGKALNATSTRHFNKKLRKILRRVEW